jgi:GNAT superfamily N-acetyltransferase
LKLTILGLLVNKSLTMLIGMTTISIDVRRAEPFDAAAIAETHDASWRHAYAGMLPYKALDAMVRRRGTEWWERALRNSTAILVLDIGDKIVGYVTLGPNRVSTLPFDGEIYEIYLLPEYQGLGFGAKLFSAARHELQALGMNGLVVWALEDNLGANNFYLNAGGRDVAEGSETFDGASLKKIAYAWH